jgi:hydroxymethylbilane synthase
MIGMNPLFLGTRGSALARVQTRLVREALHAVDPQLLLEEKIITTKGDENISLALDHPVMEGSGLFTRKLEEALMAHQIDAAIHSLKDLPVVTPRGLILAAILPRGEVSDLLITLQAPGWGSLTSGNVVGTSSPRRLEWVRLHRADLVVKPIRGNVLTRLKKLITEQAGERFHGLLLARAGLERLGFEVKMVQGEGSFLFEGRELFVTELRDLLPAPGQGALAVETRTENNLPAFEEALQKIHHSETARCVAAERLLLYYLGGGCHMALGALATIDPSSQQLYLRASYVPSPLAKPREGEAMGFTPEEVALRVATQLGEKFV